jgi:molybdenum cofactor cytidylyltransferase
VTFFFYFITKSAIILPSESINSATNNDGNFGRSAGWSTQKTRRWAASSWRRGGRCGSLLADFGSAPLIARALDVTETPALAARVVVTRSPEVAELACKAGVKTILHSLLGRNDTVRLGLEALLSELPGLAGCIFLPGDQPLLRKESLEAMARDFSALDEKERAILRLGFRAEDGTERLGSPVLFGSSYFGALCSLPEGKGGGVVIRQHPESVQAVYAARQEELEDADTAEELERLRKFL